MSKKKQIDPIPEEFASYEEAAAFWDTHETMDYPDAFKTVKVVSELRGRHYEIEIEADVVKALRIQARQSGVKLSQLVSQLLRQQLPLEIIAPAGCWQDSPARSDSGMARRFTRRWAGRRVFAGKRLDE